MILLADTVGDGAVTKEVTEATSEAVQEVGKFAQYVNDNIPELIGFGIRVFLALIVFFIGTKIIKLLRKLVRRSLQKSTVDKGVEQFVDSMLKFVLYIILIFSIGSNFGIDTTSVAALLASGGGNWSCFARRTVELCRWCFNFGFETICSGRLYY